MTYSERTTYALGTIIQFKLCGKNAEKAIEQAIERVNDIDDKMSVFKEYSEIWNINMKAGSAPQEVSPDTYFLLKKVLGYSELSEGAFDPTIRPLVDLWGIGTSKEHIPEKAEIEEKLKLVNYKDVVLNEKESSVMLRQRNQSLDLGGIAKGYAADEIRDIFIKNRIKSALIDLGGNIFALGKKIDGKNWRVGIQDPFRPRGEFAGIINVTNKSVVTSGNYEKYFISEDRRFHHIIDPRTGYPSESSIISATIISDDSLEGDGLSTGIYILDVDKALKLIESREGIEAILITENKNIFATSGIIDEYRKCFRNVKED